jgi:glycosyltransferase involved in cell wall biosynthesis
VVLVPNPSGGAGFPKRLRQLRSLASKRSFERLRVTLPQVQPTLDRVLLANQFDVVDLEFPYLGHCRLRQAPAGQQLPAIVVNSHNIEFDLVRQHARRGSSFIRRLYAEANWRKLRREEWAAYRDADGACFCSGPDEQKVLAEMPGLQTTVIPNGADIDYYQPRSDDPPPDGRTIVFFGHLSYVPNVDGLKHFLKNIWPLIAEFNPDARFKIIGDQPPASLRALAGSRVEFTGFVTDLRPHLATAAVVVVPLRLGGGTRLKIVEAMAMAKPIVSTSLGAEGIEALPGRDILIEDEPDDFAATVTRLLLDPKMAAHIGRSARLLAVERYAWSAAARSLEGFYRQCIERRLRGQRVATR